MMKYIMPAALGGLEREYIWRFYLPAAAFEEMLETIEMKEVSKPELSDPFWHQRRWWNPDPTAEATFMVPVDPNLHYPFALLMYDRERQLLFGRNNAVY